MPIKWYKTVSACMFHESWLRFSEARSCFPGTLRLIKSTKTDVYLYSASVKTHFPIGARVPIARLEPGPFKTIRKRQNERRAKGLSNDCEFFWDLHTISCSLYFECNYWLDGKRLDGSLCIAYFRRMGHEL